MVLHYGHYVTNENLHKQGTNTKQWNHEHTVTCSEDSAPRSWFKARIQFALGPYVLSFLSSDIHFLRLSLKQRNILEDEVFFYVAVLH